MFQPARLRERRARNVLHTLEFVLANVDKGRRFDHVGGEVVDHLRRVIFSHSFFLFLIARTQGDTLDHELKEEIYRDASVVRYLWAVGFVNAVRGDVFGVENFRRL